MTSSWSIFIQLCREVEINILRNSVPHLEKILFQSWENCIIYTGDDNRVCCYNQQSSQYKTHVFFVSEESKDVRSNISSKLAMFLSLRALLIATSSSRKSSRMVEPGLLDLARWCTDTHFFMISASIFWPLKVTAVVSHLP